MKNRLLGKVLIIALAASALCGCTGRVPGPELQYSPSDVELIRQQIEAIDW